MSEQLELDFREWKPVEGYESLYELRSDGLLHSYPRNGRGERYTYGSKMRKYMFFSLNKDKQQIVKSVHRLVWETFVGPIPEGYDVHHINHIRTDNRLENLCLIEHNMHSLMHKEDRNTGTKEKLSKPVLQYTLDGEFIKEYPSIREASRQTKINRGCIAYCCRKHPSHKTAGGSIWKYAS